VRCRSVSVLLVIGLCDDRELALRTFLRDVDRLWLVDEATSPYGRCADRFVSIGDLYDEEQVEAAVRRVVGTSPPDGVLTFFDECLPYTGELVARWGLPGLGPSVSRAGLDKALMRRMLGERGVPQPSYAECRSAEEAVAAAELLGFPVCVKPTDQSASAGVRRVDAPEDVERAFAEAWRRRYRADGGVLVESWLDGRMLEVDLLLHRGEATVIGTRDQRPPELRDGAPLTRSYWAPAEAVPPNLLDVARESVAALELDDCVPFVQAIETPEGCAVLEVNARPCGGLADEMLLTGRGINIYEGQLDLALGRRPRIPPPTRLDGSDWRCSVAVVWFEAPSGVLRAIDGVEDAWAVEGVIGVRVDLTLGQEVPAMTTDEVSHGFVIASGRSAAEAEDRAWEGASRLQFQVEEP
jgi:biotin carboxylase